MKTTVTAYDEESAQRVASWRWENDRAGFEVTGGNPLGGVEIAAL